MRFVTGLKSEATGLLFSHFNQDCYYFTSIQEKILVDIKQIPVDEVTFDNW